MTRETDYAIFERVFGGKLFRLPIDLDTVKPGDVLDDEAAKKYNEYRHGWHSPATVAHYSESNAEAMAVLVRVCEAQKSWDVSICCLGNSWSVCDSDNHVAVAVIGPTLPATICKFALSLDWVKKD